MKVQILRMIIISTFIFTSASLFANDDKPEPEPEEDTILGLPCQPFPDCDVDQLRITPNSNKSVITLPRPEKKQLSHFNKRTVRVNSAK